ncbi:uncharacterized protein [Antedon mediterranea]|uniref:uncharacterized protein n=1 Tax=Antedon mediterranea TaxID=105859 RepID=UPI003AF9F8BA
MSTFSERALVGPEKRPYYLPSTVDEQFQTQFQKQTSDEQKTKLLKPESDIAARELDFQKAYNEALKDGSVPVNLGMLKVIGQEGVGKTCLINACLGKEFEEKHVLTDGIAVIRTASTTWTEAKADSGDPSKQYTKMVTDKLRAKETIDMKPPTDDDDGIVVDYNNYGNNDGAYTVTEAIPFDTEQQLDKDAIKNVVEENKEETFEETFNIYDHGGQLIYHGIHRIFMTSRSLYIVVFDLSKPLDDLATFIDSTGKKCKHQWTNLQFILSYILSVYSHSRIVEEDKGKGVHKPTILIVGTHKGKLGKSEKNQKSEAKKVFKKLRNAIKEKLYEVHVHNHYFAIENSKRTTDESFSELKKVIDEFMSDLEKDVPLKWMRFRCGIHNLRREKHFSLCPVDELKMLASENGIADESILLNFLYDLGEIIYMPDKELLRDKAVLDPMQLVEIVTAFVTVIPPESPLPMFRKAFDNLDKGILEEDLLRALWKKRKVDEGKNFKFLVKLMIQLGFICERETTSSQDVASTSTESVGKRSFFVPLRLAFKTSTEVKPVPDEFPAISVYYDFKGYLPDVLFPYMIIDFLNKFQKKGVDPILLYNHAELYFDQDHDVTLSLVKVITMEDERKFLLKVTIKRTPARNETSNEEPSSEACKEVLLTIQKSFEPTKDGGRRGIQYERCILCDVCSDASEKKHIQNLEDFQYRKLKCTKTGKSVTMDVTRYQRLFGGDVGTASLNPGVPLSTVKRKSAWTSTGTVLSMSNYRKLLVEVSSWWEEHDKINLLKFILLMFKQVTLTDIEKSDDPFELFELLGAPGIISPSNVDVLLEAVVIGGMEGVDEEKIKQLIPSFPGFSEIAIPDCWDKRQKLIKFGRKIGIDEQKKVGRVCGVKSKPKDVWALMFELERQRLFTEERTKFLQLLKDIDLDRHAALLE